MYNSVSGGSPPSSGSGKITTFGRLCGPRRIYDHFVDFASPKLEAVASGPCSPTDKLRHDN
jgi:hypothetical protein